jgi:hypothetical protein
MDLSQISTEDLLALKAGDLSKVSTAGLQSLKKARAGADLKKSNPGEYDPSSKEYAAKYGATSGMGGFEKFVAGYGAAVPQMARGVGQLLGINSQEEVDEAKRLEAPLMDSGAGMAGNILGNVAATAPAIAVPGAATLRGAGAIGSVLGFSQPVATGDSRLTNTIIGGGANMGGVAAGRTVAAGWQGAKALVEPFTGAGRDRIAGRTLQRFADDPSKIAGTTSAPTITGARPTLAEQTGDAGLARLQDSLRSLDPQIENQIGGRLSENNAARVASLRTLTGEDGARDFAKAHRSSTGSEQYERAFSVPVKMEDLTPSMRGEVTKLMQMPAIKEAMTEAQTNAANFGMKGNADNVIAGLHQTKLAMDDAISRLSDGGAKEANKAAGIKAARDRLVTFMEKMSPDYQEARVTYAQMSKPVNSMDTAAEVAKRGLSNATDLSGTPTINRGSLLGALKDEKALVSKATGRKGLGNLSDVMEPQDLNLLRAIASETDRAGAVATAGNGPGSATAQRMASQNILRQMVGPTGLPSSWAESALANTVIGKPFNLIYGGVAEPKIQQALAQAVLDPSNARRVFDAARIPVQQQNMLLQLVQRGAKLAPAAGLMSGDR